MITVTRKFKDGEREFPVYTEQEAKDLGIEYVHWKSAKGMPDGTWVATDDGYVCQTMKMTDNFIKATIFITQWRVKSVTALTRIQNKSYATFIDLPFEERLIRLKRVKRAIGEYAKCLYLGVAPDFDKIGRIIQPSSKIPEATAKRILRYGKVRDMVKENVKQLFITGGMTEQEVVTLYQHAVEFAKAKKNPLAMLAIADRMAEYLEMAPTKPGKNFIEFPNGDDGSVSFLKSVTEAEAQLIEGDSHAADKLEASPMVDPTRDVEYVDPRAYIDGSHGSVSTPEEAAS